MEIEEHGLSLKDLTVEQRMEVYRKEMIYGTVYIFKYEDGRIEIKGLGELE